MISNSNVSIFNSCQHTLKSKIINDSFRIDIALPQNYNESKDKYPVLFLMDTNIFFPIVSGAARIMHFGKQIENLIIVGVGYPDESKHMYLRNRDYCPTKYDMPEIAGECDSFIEFLKQELMPYIKDNYRVDYSDTCLAGDSLSGLFAMYVLFTQPDLFNKYIAGSPSLYWDSDIIFEIEKQYAKNHTQLNAQDFMSVGQLESIQEPEFAGMVRNVEKMRDILLQRNYTGLNLTTHIFENESHLSVIPATFSRGLRTVFLKCD